MWKHDIEEQTKPSKGTRGRAGTRSIKAMLVFRRKVPHQYVKNLKSSATGEHSSYHLQKQYIVPVENNYQPIEGNGGKENEKAESKNKGATENYGQHLLSYKYLHFVCVS